MLDVTAAVIFVVTMLFAYFFLKKKSRLPPGKVIQICSTLNDLLKICTNVQINVFQCDIYDRNAFMEALEVFLRNRVELTLAYPGKDPKDNSQVVLIFL